MNIIVAVEERWGIGKENQLLTYISEDLKYFKAKTLGKVVVMGRKTLESLPGQKPLPGRTNIVLSRDKAFKANCTVCHSEEELLEEIQKYEPEEVYIIGGAQIYSAMLHRCDRFFITKIFGSFDADRHFENLDLRQDIELVWESEIKEQDGLKYKFTEYRRK